MMSLMEAAAGQTQDKHRTKKMIWVSYWL